MKNEADASCRRISTPQAASGRNVRLSPPPKGKGQSWCILRQMENTDRPPIAGLTCVYPECPSYGQAGQGSLIARMTYGPDQVRYQGRVRWIRCRSCQSEFSERKNTPFKDGLFGPGLLLNLSF